MSFHCSKPPVICVLTLNPVDSRRAGCREWHNSYLISLYASNIILQASPAFLKIRDVPRDFASSCHLVFSLMVECASGQLAGGDSVG